MGNPVIPKLSYLIDCSPKSLQDLELASLNRSSQCLKTAKAELEEAVAQREVAGIARFLIENRDKLLESRPIDISSA